MKQSIFEVKANTKIAENTYKMVLGGDCSGITASGQFVNIKLDGFFLRRPISVCDYNDNELTLIYKVVGKGTEYMAELGAGEKLDILTGLGNGYDLSKSGNEPVLIGGVAEGKKPQVILGFNKENEVFFENEFKALGADVTVTTADGSYGMKGFVTDALKTMKYTYIYSCGPEPMLKAIYNTAETSGQLSFEERMGCGFGACMGCSCATKYGNKRICKDGPVLEMEEIIW